MDHPGAICLSVSGIGRADICRILTAIALTTILTKYPRGAEQGQSSAFSTQLRETTPHTGIAIYTTLCGSEVAVKRKGKYSYRARYYAVRVRVSE